MFSTLVCWPSGAFREVRFALARGIVGRGEVVLECKVWCRCRMAKKIRREAADRSGGRVGRFRGKQYKDLDTGP